MIGAALPTLAPGLSGFAVAVTPLIKAPDVEAHRAALRDGARVDRRRGPFILVFLAV